MFQLTIEVGAREFLLGGDALLRLQELLSTHAPAWSSALQVFRDRRARHAVDLGMPRSLLDAVGHVAIRQGEHYRDLVRLDGIPPAERLLGSAELCGAGPAVSAGVSLDEYPIRARGDGWGWGNSLGITVYRRRIEGEDAVVWSRRMFTELCAALSPFHAFASMDGEFDAKNLSHEGGGLQALGRDVSRALPGVYWLNFFGEPYCDLIGRERLLSTPAHEVRAVDEGVLLMIHPDPEAWDTPAYRSAEDRILAHVGRPYFFDRDDPSRETIAPPFDLPPLADPLRRRFQVYHPGAKAEPGAKDE